MPRRRIYDQKIDKELRLMITRDQFKEIEQQADAEQREIANMVRVLLGEALAARKELYTL